MSFLVERRRDLYPDNALDSFEVTSEFNLKNARVMMWMSQLAYETADETKVDDILGSWSLIKREFIDNPTGRLPSLRTSCGIVAGGLGATIVALAGTDPLKINDWITDLSALPSPDGVHTGFQEAVAAIWPRIARAIDNRAEAERAVFFTGHSLGGALAIVAADRALRELGVRATAVYTFGSPRVGSAKFASAYTPALGGDTYRLVHGTDIVATVPPSLSGFRHVGRVIQCDSDGRFDALTPISSPDADKPDYLGSLFTSVRNKLRAVMAGQLDVPVVQGLLQRSVELLPRQIRDHVPVKYFKALDL